MPFDTNVFINCPFDNDYKRLLNPLLFTVLYCRLDPQISQFQGREAGRIDEITRLMRGSKYSIHDISRMGLDVRTHAPRFNMPLELGIDYGIRNSDSPPYAEKRIVVFDEERYRYHVAVSDWSGYDIFTHNNNPRKFVLELRKCLTMVHANGLHAGTLIWDDFNIFTYDLETVLRVRGFSNTEIKSLPRTEYIAFAKHWIDHRVIL